MKNIKKRDQSFEEGFAQAIAEAAERAERNGVSPEQIDELIESAVPEAIDTAAAHVVSLILKSKRTLRSNKRLERGFDRRLAKKWGAALDLYTVVAACCLEAGEEISQKASPDLPPLKQATLEALVRLHAQACRVAGEVHALLASGHPDGAIARCRTLHELAVISVIIGSASEEPHHEDIAQRFLDHEIITLYKEKRHIYENYVSLNLPRPDVNYMDDLRRKRDALLIQYGDSFKGDYGWAKEYVPNDNLYGLEVAADMAHMRPYYHWANAQVHGGARGLGLNLHEFRGQIVRRVGKTNTGLGEPASMALGSLIQATVSLILKGNPDSPSLDVAITAQSIIILNEKCREALAEAQENIDRDEEEFQRKDARRGKR